MPKLTLGFSPCPNDTFIFDALVNGKIDTGDLTFDIVMEDVEELNKKAFQGTLDITKLSYHALAYRLEEYELLHAGSALGNNCGPLLIGREKMPKEAIEQATIAIPGKYTTANFLLGLAFPNAKNKKELLFSDIENAVLNKSIDLGLIIHENRFTYQEKGLVKIIDLGEYWETKTQLPIPLGGIVVKRSLEENIKKKINYLLRKSVAMALANPQSTIPYVRQYAQEMNEAVMMKHIQLYVNDYTVDLGEKGRKAVSHLFNTAWEKALIPPFKGNVLLNV